MRESIRPFFERYVGASSLTVQAGTITATGHASIKPSLTDQVVEVFQRRPDAVLDADEVLKDLTDDGVETTREAVRNAIHYAARNNRIHKQRRGRFTLKDTSTPAATGVDAGEEPASGSSGEIGGGRDEASTPPHDQGGRAFNAQFRLDRAGDRAPIGG
jgi:hypothetical protein